jgi:WS/DGAT/MGAT family acyltransferase
MSREGGLDFDRIRDQVESRLHQLPHYRQRLAYTPIQRHPIWVDDERFDLDLHVRHVGLPSPGSDEQLKEFTGRISSQALNRDRPLWELWVVEGLSGDRFAVVAKVHHCLVDGVSGVGMLNALLSSTPDPTLGPIERWKPQPRPSTLEFLGDGATETARAGIDVVRTVGDALLNPRESVSALWETTRAGIETVGAGLTSPAVTPINRPIGTQRRVDWLSLDLAEVRGLRKRLDGSLNDVVLAIVSGAMRSFLRQRRVALKGLDFRIIVPVNTRLGPIDMSIGNRVSAWFLSLPLADRDPLRRFAKIRTQTRRLKKARTAIGIDRFLRFADWTGSTRLTFLGVNFVSMIHPYNLIVTNVHGPPFPLYMLGAPLLEFHPQVPLFEEQGLAVAAMSYAGKMSFGLTGDWDLLPDLSSVASAITESFDELRRAAENRA